jgi:hypothetical protein
MSKQANIELGGFGTRPYVNVMVRNEYLCSPFVGAGSKPAQLSCSYNLFSFTRR